MLLLTAHDKDVQSVKNKKCHISHHVDKLIVYVLAYSKIGVNRQLIISSRSDPAFRFYGLARTFCCIRIKDCVAVFIVKERDQSGQHEINNNPQLNDVNSKKQ